MGGLDSDSRSLVSGRSSRRAHGGGGSLHSRASAPAPAPVIWSPRQNTTAETRNTPPPTSGSDGDTSSLGSLTPEQKRKRIEEQNLERLRAQLLGPTTAVTGPGHIQGTFGQPDPHIDGIYREYNLPEGDSAASAAAPEDPLLPAASDPHKKGYGSGDTPLPAIVQVKPDAYKGNEKYAYGTPDFMFHLTDASGRRIDASRQCDVDGGDNETFHTYAPFSGEFNAMQIRQAADSIWKHRGNDGQIEQELADRIKSGFGFLMLAMSSCRMSPQPSRRHWFYENTLDHDYRAEDEESIHSITLVGYACHVLGQLAREENQAVRKRKLREMNGFNRFCYRSKEIFFGQEPSQMGRVVSDIINAVEQRIRHSHSVTLTSFFSGSKTVSDTRYLKAFQKACKRGGEFEINGTKFSVENGVDPLLVHTQEGERKAYTTAFRDVYEKNKVVGNGQYSVFEEGGWLKLLRSGFKTHARDIKLTQIRGWMTATYNAVAQNHGGGGHIAKLDDALFSLFKDLTLMAKTESESNERLFHGDSEHFLKASIGAFVGGLVPTLGMSEQTRKQINRFRVDLQVNARRQRDLRYEEWSFRSFRGRVWMFFNDFRKYLKNSGEYATEAGRQAGRERVQRQLETSIQEYGDTGFYMPRSLR